MSKKCMVIPTNILLEKDLQGFSTKDFHDYLSIINNPDNQKFLERYETSIIQKIPAEKDPSFQQIIPYVVLIHNGKIFLYERPSKGVTNEDRYSRKLSIGLGGHIEPIDESEDDKDLIVKSIQREIQEEVGYYEKLFVNHKGYINFTPKVIETSNQDLDLFHFGVIFTAEIKENNFTSNKEVVHGSFKTKEELKSSEVYNRLENWSRVLVENIDRII